MINLSIGLTELSPSSKYQVLHTHEIHQLIRCFLSLSQRKLSIGTNSDPETTLDTTAGGDVDKAEKKKKKKRKKDAEAGETEAAEPAAEEQAEADEAGDDEASKKEKKKKKKKDKNKEKSDE